MKQEKNRCLLVFLVLIVLLGGILCNGAVMTAHAENESAFLIEAEMLPSDKQTYDIRLTVENLGEDWEGMVRLIVNEGYRQPCAYDTALSLPQGSRKQFVVKVPVNSIDSTDGTVVVTLLDRRNRESAVKEFKRLMTGQLESLSMGILSDAYSELTYLDMGGDDIFFYDDSYPIKLVELQQGNLADSLDALTFLVIDKYNTDILTDEELEAIESWNLNGGVLIVGTGAYAEDTLRGFDDGHLGISCNGTYTLEDASDFYAGESVDWSKLTMAELQDVRGKYTNYNTAGWSEEMGDGSICVLPYSLTELGEADDIYLDYYQEYFVMLILEDACACADSRYSSKSYYDDFGWNIRRMLGALGRSNSILNLGVLKVIVVLYVVFVGPVLYLILRLVKRRELYWIAVPTTALLAIGLVFLSGRGYEVAHTNVYSVTVDNLSDSQKSGTYLYCYDAERREWDLKLAQGCEYVGPFGDMPYYNGLGTPSYYYHIKKEGDVFSFGINPGSNFEDSYFYLSNVESGGDVEGNLLMRELDKVVWYGTEGTVVNNTNKDMDYFAVLCDNNIGVYENLPAGAVCSLEDMEPLYTDTITSYYYGFVTRLYSDGEYEKVGAMSALGVAMSAIGVGSSGVSTVLLGDEVIIIGVVENWDKIVDDDCNEISYGCFYSIQ